MFISLCLYILIYYYVDWIYIITHIIVAHYVGSFISRWFIRDISISSCLHVICCYFHDNAVWCHSVWHSCNVTTIWRVISDAIAKEIWHAAGMNNIEYNQTPTHTLGYTRNTEVNLSIYSSTGFFRESFSSLVRTLHTVGYKYLIHTDIYLGILLQENINTSKSTTWAKIQLRELLLFVACDGP